MITLLIDGPNLLQRAVHAASARQLPLSSGGVATAPLLIFANSLSRHIRDLMPTHVAVCWDGGSHPGRLMLDPHYKEGRGTDHTDDDPESSYGLAYAFLAHCQIQSLKHSGVEADDLVAAFWRSTRGKGPIFILSGDKDFRQLLENDTGIALPNEDVVVSSTAHYMKQGYDPRYAAAVSALVGDRGDNVIGVPGIGPVRAKKLLEAHDWDLEALLASGNPKLTGFEDLVRRNYKLVDLRTAHFPLPPLPDVGVWNPTLVGSAAWQDLARWLDRYDLESIRRRMEQNQFWGDTPLALRFSQDAGILPLDPVG